MKNAKNNSSKSTKTILIVEDDRFLANAYRLKLERTGYEILLASNGQEALNMLKNKKPNLIVLDLIMPGMDGFTVLEKIKKDPSLKKIPVIVGSNLGQKEDFERVQKLGADDYFIKSNTTLENLLVKIESLLKH